MDRQKRHIDKLKKKVARFERNGKKTSGLMRDLANQTNPGKAGRPGQPSLRFLGQPRCCWPKNKMIDSMIERGGRVPAGSGSEGRPKSEDPLKKALAQPGPQ